MILKKRLFYIFTLVLILAFSVFNSSATSMKAPVSEIIGDNYGNLLSVAYRGDTASFPENSLEAVISAKEKGADMVSVSVRKTKDGVLVLCEDESLGNICNAPFESIGELTSDEVKEYNLYDNSGKLTEFTMCTLEELLNATDEFLHIILDIEWQDKEAVCDLLQEKDALTRVSLRTKESAREIVKWIETKGGKINVIGIYDGNIIWNSISHIRTLSDAGMSMAQYQSKNYFNVMYGSWTYNNFSVHGNARAIAPTYNPDLCGQRSDSANGWNELVKKGFTVIETNNIEVLSKYIENNVEMRANLSELLEKAKAIETERYSLVSKDNLADGIAQAEEVLSGTVKSLDEAEKAYSKLLFYMNEMKISDGEETTRGALNITAGKVVATFLVGAAILSGQIFVHKMHKKRR